MAATHCFTCAVMACSNVVIQGLYVLPTLLHSWFCISLGKLPAISSSPDAKLHEWPATATRAQAPPDSCNTHLRQLSANLPVLVPPLWISEPLLLSAVGVARRMYSAHSLLYNLLHSSHVVLHWQGYVVFTQAPTIASLIPRQCQVLRNGVF